MRGVGKSTWARQVLPDAQRLAMLKGLRAVSDLDGLARRILAYRGRRAFRTEDGIDVWPLESLHLALRDDQIWP